MEKMDLNSFLTFKTLCDDVGRLLYEGFTYNGKPFGAGKVYWPNGNIFMEGKFGLFGLVIGTEYYPDGKPRFAGNYYIHYREPNLPYKGNFYNKAGEPVYSGEIEKQQFRIERKIAGLKDFGPVLQSDRPVFPVFSSEDESLLEKAIIRKLYPDYPPEVVKCPLCGKVDAVRILYDVPGIDDEFKVLVGYESAWFSWRGQDVYDPGYRCNSCKRSFDQWGYTYDAIMFWGFPETLEEIRFSRVQARTCVNTYTITIKHTFSGGHVTSSGRTKHLILNDDYDISPKRWKTLASTLYNKLFLNDWKQEYKPEGYEVLDGESWCVEASFGGFKKTYTGNNAYPPYWSEFVKLLRSYTRGKRVDAVSGK